MPSITPSETASPRVCVIIVHTRIRRFLGGGLRRKNISGRRGDGWGGGWVIGAERRRDSRVSLKTRNVRCARAAAFSRWLNLGPSDARLAARKGRPYQSRAPRDVPNAHTARRTWSCLLRNADMKDGRSAGVFVSVGLLVFYFFFYFTTQKDSFNTRIEYRYRGGEN